VLLQFRAAKHIRSSSEQQNIFGAPYPCGTSDSETNKKWNTLRLHHVRNLKLNFAETTKRLSRFTKRMFRFTKRMFYEKFAWIYERVA
jgi:hypothetical protein